MITHFLYSDIQGVTAGKERRNCIFSGPKLIDFQKKTTVELYSDKVLIKEMNDNGEDGDETAGNHIYSCTHAVELSAW